MVTMFLTLVGLTALAVGGVGAGQAVGAFLDRKRAEIATLKALGAEGGTIFLMFFLQVMTIALAAVLLGLVLGAMLPFALGASYGADIPAPAIYAVYAGPLWLAAAFGIFSAAAFAIPPLARAFEVAPAMLFRDVVAPGRVRGRLPYLALAAGCRRHRDRARARGRALAAFRCVFHRRDRGRDWWRSGLFAQGFRWVLRRLPRPSSSTLRLALANLTRPGAATSSVVVALGLGLTLLSAVMLLDGTIASQVKDELPSTAPTFFFVDIPPDEVDAFDTTIHRFHADDYNRAPMVRARITSLNGVPSRLAKVDEGSRWALAGDRGITYA